jgi:hypothetical protein
LGILVRGLRDLRHLSKRLLRRSINLLVSGWKRFVVRIGCPPGASRADSRQYQIALTRVTQPYRKDTILRSYFDYYHKSRTHLSLDKDAPEPRAVQNPRIRSLAEWWHCRKLAGFIITMSGEPPDIALNLTDGSITIDYRGEISACPLEIIQSGSQN